jgi:L-lactate utilization protein LutC
VTDLEETISARQSILGSIREHLAASAPYDAVHAEKAELQATDLSSDIVQEDGYQRSAFAGERELRTETGSLIEIFRENLEAAGGHCMVARNELEVKEALTSIIHGLQETPLRARRIALSNSPAVERVFRDIRVEVDQVAVDPGAAELFGYDVGVSTAQSAIAETGTLVLESEAERHRLVSLVPPVHIAIVAAENICLTLGEALEMMGQGYELSPTVTLITGPSRTADIELTLAIGVHGPQELYVVVLGH